MICIETSVYKELKCLALNYKTATTTIHPSKDSL